MLAFDAEYTSLLYEYLEAQGLSAESILGESWTPATRISATRWQEMLLCAAHASGQPAFGIHIANSVKLRHLGVIGYLLMSCANPLEALQRTQRFNVLISGVNPMQVAIEADQLVVSWPLLHGWCGQLQDEMGLATAVQLCRILSGVHQLVTRVDFVAPYPDSIEPYESFFGCEVRFGQDMPRLVTSIDNLSLPILGADTGLCMLLDEQAERRLQQLAPVDLEMQQLRQQLLQLIREGRPRLADLAAHSGVSIRALQRRLARRGSSFQSLLEETRTHLATQYLADTRLALHEVAELLGYADQATFTRAFSQWENCSPGSWRQLHLANL